MCEKYKNHMYWTPEAEHIARRIISQSDGYAWMYDKMATNDKYLNDSLNILSGAIGGIAGTISVATIPNGSDPSLWAKIIGAIAGYIVGLISVMIAVWKLSDEQMNSVTSRQGYSSLSANISYQLSRPPYDRCDAREYIPSKIDELEKIKVSSPVIWACIKQSYRSKFGNAQEINAMFSPETNPLFDQENDGDSYAIAGSNSSRSRDPMIMMECLVAAYEEANMDKKNDQYTIASQS